MSDASYVEVGPWGGDGGNLWQFHLGKSRITGVTVRSDSKCVHSIQFTYVDLGGTSHVSPIFGTDGGISETLSFANEKLTHIGGTFGAYYPQHVIITSLSFTTNLQRTHTYGPGGGTTFSLPLKEGKVAGFFGNAGDRLESLGVIIKGVDILEVKSKAVDSKLG